jgi:hypothetical protein
MEWEESTVSESGGSYGVDEEITPKNFEGTQREEQDLPPLAGDVTQEKSTPLPWQQEAMRLVKS